MLLNPFYGTIGTFHTPLGAQHTQSVDAFRQKITKERAYTNPPFDLITRLLGMVKRQRARLPVVPPAWEAQPRWPLLAELLITPPIRLPRRFDTFLPGHLGNDLPMGVPRLTVIAATISGAPCFTAVFRTRWRELCRTHGTTFTPFVAMQRRGDVGSIFVLGLGSILSVDLI